MGYDTYFRVSAEFDNIEKAVAFAEFLDAEDGDFDFTDIGTEVCQVGDSFVAEGEWSGRNAYWSIVYDYLRPIAEKFDVTLCVLYSFEDEDDETHYIGNNAEEMQYEDKAEDFWELARWLTENATAANEKSKHIVNRVMEMKIFQEQ